MISFIEKYPKFYQLFRYGIVGVLNNLLGYALYLLITFFWLEPKLTITLLYPVGIAIAYYTHAKYSFAYQAGGMAVKIKFFMAYLVGYAINYLMLFVFSDKLNFSHQIVQAVAVFVVGGALFIMLKYLVFTVKIKV